jgi:hypothetical protein
MFITSQDQAEHFIMHSQQLHIAIWKRSAEDFAGANIEDKDAVTVSWGNTRFPFWNFLFISESVHSSEQLNAAIDEAAAIAATKTHSGLISVCPSLLDKRSRELPNSILSAVGYPISIPMTGYGEAIVRHALQKAHEATNLIQAALHAPDMGRPVYERIGFQPVADLRWYMQQHN